MKKILITGGTGYIGNAFLNKYALAYSFKAFGRTKPAQSVEFFQGDIKDITALKKAAFGVDAILHLAAVTTDKKEVTDEEYINTNIVGTHNVLKAAAENKVKKVVFMSSVCAVGFRPDKYPVREDEKCNPTDGMYGFSKFAGERLCRYYSEEHGINIVCLRPSMVVPQHEFIPPKKGSMPWIGYVDIEDVLQEIALGLENEHIKYGVFHAAPDNRFSMFDISKAKEMLGYSPKHNFEEFTKTNALAYFKSMIKKIIRRGKG